MLRYEAASMALWRANESRSLNCHAIWGYHRRNIVRQPFEQILNGSTPMQVKVDLTELTNVIALLQSGEDEVAFNHLEDQRAQLKSYIRIVFKLTREQIRLGWEEHKSGKGVSYHPMQFYT